MKFSQYDYFFNCNDGVGIVNIFNSKYVKITKEDDIEHLMQLCHDELPLKLEDNMVKTLYEQGYIVDSNIDEYAIAKAEVEQHMEQLGKRLRIVLYVTDQCNFRCIYCPEKHINNSFSDENWNALYKYIEKGVKSAKYNFVQVSFFGGEPTLELSKIVPFLEKLKRLSKEYPNILFLHHITSNGYLLTPEVYDKLVSLDVLHYQITVDGFAETHNNNRPLVGGQGTWDRIIENLKYINMKDDKSQVVIRANYNTSNVKSLEEYKKWQKETFTHPKFIFEYYAVSAFSENVPKDLLADAYSEDSLNVEEKLKNGMQYIKKFHNICNAAYSDNYTISTKGEITKCENISSDDYESMVIGHLSEDGDFVFKEGAEAWFEDFETEGCRECIAYPICCARCCPAKKVEHPDTRPDCAIKSENFEKRLKHLFENNV